MDHRFISRTGGIALGLALALTACNKEEPPPPRETVRPVKMLTVGRGETAARTLPGRVEADRKADLSFRVGGPLVELPVEEGQQVDKGQLIARIDPRDFRTRVERTLGTLREAQAQLKAMQAGARAEEIRALEAAVSAARAQLTNAEAQYQRYKGLYVKRQVSKAEFDRYRTARDVARAQLRTAEENLSVGMTGARPEDIEAKQSQIQGLRAQLRDARNALADTELRAPFAGVITRRYVDNYQEVQPRQPVVTLQDLSRLEVVVQVPESVMAAVRNQGEGRLRAFASFSTAPGRRFPLALKEYAAQADPDTQTYEVTLVMDRPEGLTLLPGMTATVTVTAPDEQGGAGPITVPATAVGVGDDGAPRVWVVDPDAMTVSPRKVVTGGLGEGGTVEIVSGLEPGERIAVTGVDLLREGMEVRDLGDLEGYGR